MPLLWTWRAAAHVVEADHGPGVREGTPVLLLLEAGLTFVVPLVVVVGMRLLLRIAGMVQGASCGGCSGLVVQTDRGGGSVHVMHVYANFLEERGKKREVEKTTEAVLVGCSCCGCCNFFFIRIFFG